MSTGIILDTTFNNSSLPTATPFGERIKALDSLVAWFQADQSSVTLEAGKIASFSDIAGGSLSLAQATAEKRSSLESAAIAGYSAAGFGGGDNSYVLGSAFDYDSPHAFALVLKPTVQAATQAIVGHLVNTLDRAAVFVAAGSEQFSWARNATAITMPFVRDEYCLMIVSWDGTSLRGEVNSLAATPAAVASPAITTPANLRLGSNAASGGLKMTGQVADLLVFDADILNDPEALDLVRNYAKYVYGVGA